MNSNGRTAGLSQFGRQPSEERYLEDYHSSCMNQSMISSRSKELLQSHFKDVNTKEELDFKSSTDKKLLKS